MLAFPFAAAREPAKLAERVLSGFEDNISVQKSSAADRHTLLFLILYYSFSGSSG